MNENEMSQLDTELEHAGEETALSPQMLLLEQLRITPEKELPKMDFLFRLFGKPCFPRRELVAITGKAKSGKTFVTSMLMACCQSRDVLAFQRVGDKPLRVLWYDTEQSDESTQDILKNRIIRLLNNTNTNLTNPTNNSCNLCNSWSEKSIDVFNVRGVAWKERRNLLCEAVRRCKPDLVIVDGIRDLVNDINDGMLAQEVMEELMHLATQTECCIVCVLHQNKSGEDRNLRGWIGTELMNKAFEVYACEKLPKRIFSLEQTLTRKYDIEQTMYFEVGDDGLPVTCGAPTDTSSKDNTDGYPQLNAEYIRHDEHDQWQVDVQRLFSDAIGGRQQVTGAELRSEVCRLSNIRSWKFYNSLLEQAVNDEVIMKSYDHAAHVIYALRPKAPIQMELYQDYEPF
jgi:KaiC/GvpD/RAD55 family RecA-like ATPase